MNTHYNVSISIHHCEVLLNPRTTSWGRFAPGPHGKVIRFIQWKCLSWLPSPVPSAFCETSWRVGVCSPSELLIFYQWWLFVILGEIYPTLWWLWNFLPGWYAPYDVVTVIFGRKSPNFMVTVRLFPGWYSPYVVLTVLFLIMMTFLIMIIIIIKIIIIIIIIITRATA